MILRNCLNAHHKEILRRKIATRILFILTEYDCAWKCLEFIKTWNLILNLTHQNDDFFFSVYFSSQVDASRQLVSVRLQQRTSSILLNFPRTLQSRRDRPPAWTTYNHTHTHTQTRSKQALFLFHLCWGVTGQPVRLIWFALDFLSSCALCTGRL